ncbi:MULTISPECIES: conjugal transfer protein [unclassified Streptomyces]|uniref:conjugal transfer protein n=1 Tax=unclassified Streptomyces TaxID=2593676 RepID=UPI0033190364
MRAQKIVLGVAFVPMAATGGAGGYGTYSNIAGAYGSGTAAGAVAAGEGATAVLALVLLGLTMLGQSSPRVIRAGLWALPAAAAVMSAMAADDLGKTVVFALTPMGMTASAEGAAFLARRIVVYRDGRDAEAEAHAAAVVQALAYQRARAANHPDEKVRHKSELKAWKLAEELGAGDLALGSRLLDVQRDRITEGADAALVGMFGTSTSPALPAASAPLAIEGAAAPAGEPIAPQTEAESSETGTEQSTSDVLESTPEQIPAPSPVAGEEESTPTDRTPAEPPVDRIAARAVAADRQAPRRATGRVPDAARSTPPRRTREQLLAEARQITEAWPVEQLTADRIRKAVRTSPANGRWLRETLRGERTAVVG